MDIFRIQEVLVSGCCSVCSGYFPFCIDHIVFQPGQVLDQLLSGICSGCIGYHAVFVEVVRHFSGFLLLDALSVSIVQVFLCQADRLVSGCAFLLLRYSCRTQAVFYIVSILYTVSCLFISLFDLVSIDVILIRNVILYGIAFRCFCP